MFAVMFSVACTSYILLCVCVCVCVCVCYVHSEQVLSGVKLVLFLIFPRYSLKNGNYLLNDLAKGNLNPIAAKKARLTMFHKLNFPYSCDI